MEFHREHSLENLNFHLDVNYYKSLFGAKSASEAVAARPEIKEVALGIYESFVAPGSRHEININQDLRCALCDL